MYSRMKFTQIWWTPEFKDYLKNGHDSIPYDLIAKNLSDQMRKNPFEFHSTSSVFPLSLSELIDQTEYAVETGLLERNNNTEDALGQSIQTMLRIPEQALEAMVSQFVQIESQIYLFNLLNYSDDSGQYLSKYVEEEEIILHQMLKTSTSIATILPAVDCFRYKQNLASAGFQCDVGIQQYSIGTTGIIYEGRLNVKLLQRIRWTEHSGVISWWNSYLQHGMIPDVTIPVRAASMAGNILVVFIVLLVGILASSIIWLVQICIKSKSICGSLKPCLCVLSQSCVRVYSKCKANNVREK